MKRQFFSFIDQLETL